MDRVPAYAEVLSAEAEELEDLAEEVAS
jgi:hypothetical protein